MIYTKRGINRLELTPETDDGAYLPYSLRWYDASDPPVAQWDLHRDAANNLTVYNHATDTQSLWVADDDVVHVQDIAIEGTSTLDAGTLDGLDSSQFVRSDTDITHHANFDVTGTLAMDSNTVLTTADEGSLDAGTLEGATLAQTRPAVADDGTVVHASPSEWNLGQYLQATDDGDGTVTLDSTGGNAVGTTATASGDGATTTFTLPHGLGTTPASVTVEARTEDAMADFHTAAVRTDDLDITYAGPPPTGTDNLSWDVTAFGNDGSGTHAVSIEDDGAVVDLASTLDFNTGLTVSNPSDGAVSVTADLAVTNDTAAVESPVTGLDFGANITAQADGDGTVTITGSDTYPSVSENGSVVEVAPGDINAGSGIVANSDGDGTVTLTATENADTVDGVDANQLLRSDINATHDATLGLTTLDAAGSTIRQVADIAPDAGVGTEHVAGSARHAFRTRRDGLHALADGANLPMDYATTLEADAAVAFIESDGDAVTGWVDTNTASLVMRGGARFGDVGGPPAAGLALDVRGEARLRFENRTSDPANPATGRAWVRTDAV